ncbi:CDP-diacylglycerol--glycerol-3-phosphate 3-phosphatidyltransferase [Candidatus Margulisiibacteriota bacterium]
MTAANQVTFLRIALIPLVSIILLSPCLPYNSWIAAGLFLFVALTDLLDGYLARKLDQITDLGKVFDPLADKLLVIVVLLCLVELGKVSAIPVMVIVFRELLILGIRIVAGSRGKIIAANLGGKWKTVVQYAAILMLILSIPYGVWALWTAVALTVISGIDYIFRSKEVFNG